MKGLMRILTNGDPKVLVKPLLFQVLQSLLQGIPFYAILMVVLELVGPIEDPGEPFEAAVLLGWASALAFSLVLLFLASRSAYKVQAAAAYSIACEGRLALGEHLRKLSMGFLKGKDPGDITALMLQDYANIETMLSHMLMDALSAIALPLVFIAFLLPLDWRMTLVTVAFIPLALFVLIVARKVVSWLGAKQIRAKNDASSRMLEYLDGMKNIKAHNLQGDKFARLESSFLELRNQSIRLEASGGPMIIVGSLALYSGIALIMVFGARYVLDGSLSIASFLFFLIMGTRMYDPLNKLLVNFVELSYYAVSARRIKDVLEASPLPEPASSAPPAAHDIEFRNVTFRYRDKDVIKDASFSLEPGTMTALVGPSGSGKSTITRLIARFWDVNAGQILVGGRPVSAYSAEDLLSSMSMVFQDVYLFNDTILSNIRVGKPSASADEAMEAARKARCHEFISRLPKGYDTMVGEGGSTLSGGEKQRISIARAILKDAPIVLLDEATASLDPENELYIQEAIAELVEGRTVVVIAHRLSTIAKADQILVIKEGRVVQRGRHEALLSEAGGVYRSMWEEQSKAHAWKVRSAA